MHNMHLLHLESSNKTEPKTFADCWKAGRVGCGCRSRPSGGTNTHIRFCSVDFSSLCWSAWLQQWSGADLHCWLVLFCWLLTGAGGEMDFTLWMLCYREETEIQNQNQSLCWVLTSFRASCGFKCTHQCACMEQINKRSWTHRQTSSLWLRRAVFKFSPRYVPSRSAASFLSDCPEVPATRWNSPLPRGHSWVFWFVGNILDNMRTKLNNM